jgi:hypothetical protein
MPDRASTEHFNAPIAIVALAASSLALCRAGETGVAFTHERTLERRSRARSDLRCVYHRLLLGDAELADRFARDVVELALGEILTARDGGAR